MEDFDKHDFEKVTQEQLLELMQNDLKFTFEEIEANQQYNDRLFLSDDVIFSAVYGFEAGATFCKTTGEIIEPQVTRQTKKLKAAIDSVLGEMLDKFKDWRHDPVQREGIESLVGHVAIGLLKIEMDLKEKSDI
jgi:hypothetical protein